MKHDTTFIKKEFETVIGLKTLAKNLSTDDIASIILLKGSKDLKQLSGVLYDIQEKVVDSKYSFKVKIAFPKHYELRDEIVDMLNELVTNYGKPIKLKYYVTNDICFDSLHYLIKSGLVEVNEENKDGYKRENLISCTAEFKDFIGNILNRDTYSLFDDLIDLICIKLYGEKYTKHKERD